MDPTRRALERLAALEAEGLLRRPPRIEQRDGVRYHLAGRPVVGFCSNDYLGLSDDPRLREPSPVASGAGASRLICGDLPEHRDIEARLAALADADDAVLFPSGFQLNVGVLPTLIEADDHVDSDALVHASLIDGMRLARARPSILPHGHAPPPRLLPEHAVHWWITESIFSMDGDRLDPSAAARHLARGACMVVDEAHALGLFAGGRGLLGHLGLRPTVLVGTLSKALGCAGAFVAASRPLCTLVRNRARSFVFSTGTSPVVVARIAAALELSQGPEGDALRARLWANVAALARALELPEGSLPSPIVPVVIGDNLRAVSIAARLLDRGWHVQAIRPPTVPHGTARLRLTVAANHTREQIEALAADLRALLRDEGLPLRVERGLVSTDDRSAALCLVDSDATVTATANATTTLGRAARGS